MNTDNREILFSAIRLHELEEIVQKCVERAISNLPQATELPAPEDSLLTVQEAADFLNLTAATIYSKVSRAELPVMKEGKRLYFSRKELMDFLRSRRKLTHDEVAAKAEAYIQKTRKR